MELTECGAGEIRMKNISKKTFIISLIWKTMNLILGRGISLIFNIYFVRKLNPDTYGLMAVWSVILSLGNVFVSCGLDTILIQRPDIKKADWDNAFSSCFYRGVFLFFLLQIGAPYLSRFYNSDTLGELLRIAGIDFISQSVITVCLANAMRNMNFKRVFVADLLAALLGGGCAVISMYTISLKWTLLINTIIHRAGYAALLLLFQREKIHFSFKIYEIIEISKCGIKVMANGLLDLLTSSMTNLFSAKKWNKADVGYYQQAGKLTMFLGVETYNILSNLLLPTFSSYQHDVGYLKNISRFLMRCSCYIMFPLMLGLCVCAPEIITLLYTDKWLPAVPIVRASCIYYALNPIRQLCMNLNYSVGKYRKNMQIEFCRLIFSLLAIIFFAFIKNIEITFFALALSIVSVFISIIYIYSLKESIDYKTKESIKDIIPIFFVTLISVLPISIYKLFKLQVLVFLFVSVSTAIILYFFFSFLFKLDIFFYGVNMIKEILWKKK